MILACLLTLCLSSPARAAEPSGFHRFPSANFDIHCESFYPPEGVVNDLEGLHAKLSLDLILFAPWAKTEKVTVYIYKTSDSYHARTGARPWSVGQADPARRRIDTYEDGRLRRTMAHELAHLFFDDFFVAASSASVRRAPRWLSEGVAVNMEWDYGMSQDHPFHRARTRARWQSLGVFLSGEPGREFWAGDSVSDWYLQAYSLVRFLMRRYPGGMFFGFCDALRQGATLQEALPRAYGGLLPDVPALERQWRESLQEE